ncbi:hypothetical protein PAXINDRAFT_8652 [Paxillus involutus ATCC 200175]|nr:hypothetical protein PAXINDRAFT_8652 [Paxillus involutus ATCC 200175]
MTNSANQFAAGDNSLDALLALISTITLSPEATIQLIDAVQLCVANKTSVSAGLASSLLAVMTTAGSTVAGSPAQLPPPPDAVPSSESHVVSTPQPVTPQHSNRGLSQFQPVTTPSLTMLSPLSFPSRSILPHHTW